MFLTFIIKTLLPHGANFCYLGKCEKSIKGPYYYMLMATFWNRLRRIEHIIHIRGESSKSMTIGEMAKEFRYVFFRCSLCIYF